MTQCHVVSNPIAISMAPTSALAVRTRERVAILQSRSTQRSLQMEKTNAELVAVAKCSVPEHLDMKRED
jgi:hypothetical protein